ncbi:MAG: hypothetical protein P1U40_07705 [Coxiellaceae bacterium]|nr:hypothetical protein [Coxiellaceae bacterium]
MSKFPFLTALAIASAVIVTTPVMANTQVFNVAGVQCEQLLGNSNTHWDAHGTLHVGWFHPDIDGTVDMVDVAGSQGKYTFNIKLNLSVKGADFDQMLQAATCTDDAAGNAAITVPQSSAENLTASIETAGKIKVAGTVTAKILGHHDRFHLDHNVNLTKA